MTLRFASQKTAKERYEEARACIGRQDFEQALRCLDESLAIEETPDALHDKGIILYMSGHLDHAISCLREAIRLNPRYDQAYANLSSFMFNAGEIGQAIEYTALAMRTAPDNVAYQDNFIWLVEGMNLKVFHPDLKALVLHCLETDALDHDKLARPWLSLLKLDPDFGKIYGLPEEKLYQGFRTGREFLHEPFFLLGLRRLLVADMGLERFLTRLRRFLLEEGEDDDLELAASLAGYCFQTGYIFAVDDDERRRYEAFKDSANPLHMALLACYLPLHTLKRAEDIKRKAPDSLKNLITQQIEEPLAEHALRETISVLTTIEDRTSKDVREQYESFPYPRWKAIGLSYTATIPPDESVEKILVAGCGTGKEALEFARAFPHADILALDISLASLSYGIRKAQEFGIKNVTFKQADILKLEETGDTFDLVSASGVLHHMNDPEAGGAVLTRILRPGGYMHIALYSTLARRNIATARKIIAQKQYGNTAEDIRKFRHDAPDILNAECLSGLEIFKDYYSSPECRDLLFHVMEHTFTPAGLAQLLEKLGLTLLSLNVNDQTRALYQQAFPGDAAMTDLQNWNAFEKTHPDTFAAMYDFWCRKNQ